MSSSLDRTQIEIYDKIREKDRLWHIPDRELFPRAKIGSPKQSTLLIEVKFTFNYPRHVWALNAIASSNNNKLTMLSPYWLKF